MIKVKTSLNLECFPKTYETHKGVSMTVPDQTMSIREILRRFGAGLPLEARRDSYFDEDDPIDFGNQDYVDVFEAAQEYKHFENSKKDHYEKEKREKAKVKADNPAVSGSAS